MKSTKIVILGAGYAGVHAAKLLNKKFKKNDDIEITLIDKNPYHTLLTELHEVAGARVEPDAVQVGLKKVFGTTKVDVVTDTIVKADFKAQTIASEDSTFEYDYLIVGTGSEPASFGIPGVKEHGFSLWSLEDALKIRHHIEKVFRLASTQKDPVKRKELLTIVVAGAGFTGIEMIGELIEWKKRLCREHGIDEKEVKLMVVEAMGKILPILNDKLIRKSARYLERRHVDVITDAPIIEVKNDCIKLKDGTVIPTRTLIWTCGVQGCAFASALGLTQGKRGRLQTNEYMQSVDYDNIYIVGDNSYYEEASEGGKAPQALPQIVEAALQTAETAVKNIEADIYGKPKEAFKSKFHGIMVSIGSHYAVADLMGISMSGFLAMAMKHLVNLHYLFGVGGFNRIMAYILHEFFDIRDNRSMIGGHAANKSSLLFVAVLRVYVGVIWLVEGIQKVQQGWLTPGNIFIVQLPGVSGASEKVTGAGEAAQQIAQTVPLLHQPPALFTWFMDKFIAPHAFFFQATVVLAEIGIGLALIAGLFTLLASVGSIFLCFNFVLSAMAGVEIFWHIFAAIALMSGAGRVLGLDYYVMPWIKNWWNKTRLARKTYLYVD